MGWGREKEVKGEGNLIGMENKFLKLNKNNNLQNKKQEEKKN